MEEMNSNSKASLMVQLLYTCKSELIDCEKHGKYVVQTSVLTSKEQELIKKELFKLLGI